MSRRVEVDRRRLPSGGEPILVTLPTRPRGVEIERERLSPVAGDADLDAVLLELAPVLIPDGGVVAVAAAWSLASPTFTYISIRRAREKALLTKAGIKISPRL